MSSQFETVNYDPFRKGDVQHVVPMTQSQIEIWLSTQQAGDASKAFNLSVSLSFSGELDEDILRESLSTLGRRHEALRASFGFEKQLMLVYSEYSLSMEVISIEAANAESALISVAEHEQEKSHQIFDLENGPLFKVYLFRTGFGENFILIVTHHIIADGWSLDLLLEELEVVYNAKKENSKLCLSDVDSIAKYNVDKTNIRKTDAFKASEDYWVSQYSQSVPTLDLPLLKKIPTMRSFDAARVDVYSAENLLSRIEALLPNLGVTFFSFTYSIYLLMLHKITRQDDIVVGVPYAGQISTGRKHLFGHCVNMLPVRCSIDDQEAVIEFIRRVQSALLESKDNGEITFSDLISKVKVPRDSGRIPIISTTFNIDGGSQEYNYGGVRVHQRFNPRCYETFELASVVIKDNDQVKLQSHFNTNIYTEEQVEGWLGAYFSIVESVLLDCDQKVSSLNVLTDPDVKKFDRWNSTDSQYNTEKCVGDFVVESARKFPNKTAVVFENTQYSYQELNEKSNQVASFLSDCAVKSNEFVGLYVERSAETLVLLLGVLKSGAAYLPLDPDYPASRINFIIDDAKAKILICQRHLKDNISAFNGKLVFQDDLFDTLDQYDAKQPCCDLSSRDLAYAIYTSGSTGKPKGVQVTHQNAVNFLLSMQQRPGVNENDKLLAVTTISFDIHLLEMFLPLVCGATIEIMSRAASIDGELLVNTINQSQITVMQATPSTWRIMLMAGWSDQDRKVKALIGGEALPKDILPQLLENTDELWNMYGPTETTVWSTCARIESENGIIPIGLPIANTQLYVLDKYGQRVAPGVYGELYIGGDGVTNGYVDRPELNKNTFVDDPFSSKSNMKMYRTGDQVRLLPCGNLQYVSRLDSQVKVRGYRMELGEIETVLSSHELISQVVVVTREDKPGDVRLVAYYVVSADLAKGNEGSEMSPRQINQALRYHVQEVLPAYMLPHHFMQLDTVPQTPNGKVDRKQLPEPTYTENECVENVVEPRDDFERSILSVWHRVLKTKNIGITDSFFEHGGHSLLAISTIKDMEVATGVDFDVSSLFQNPTVKGLVESLGDDAEQSSSNIILLNDSLVEERKEKPPLFLLCGVEIYQDLANLIENRKTYGVYVFSELAIARDALDGKVSDVSFDLLCKQYVDAILRIQPDGPYELGGVSFGGFVAVEVAKRLKDLGKNVERSFLFDSVTPGAYKENFYLSLIKKSKSYILKRFNIFSKDKHSLAMQYDKKIKNESESEKAIRIREQAFVEIMKKNKANRKPYDGDVILFKAMDNVVGRWVVVDEYLGWKEMVPNSLRLVDVPGDHLGILSQKQAHNITDVINELV